ncbi:MAG: cytochrome P450 [Cyanobacteria bacterium RM1_2_2]|nr:cytochrome P450 [Cyanobacteria bacterium RM1_2_2]
MNQPPAVTTPPLWNLLQWIIQPLDFLERCTARYGDCFSLKLGNVATFNLFSDPQAIEQIFTASPTQFDSGRANGILRRMLGDNSLLLLDGQRHKRHRQLLMPPFHGERMRAYSELICQITEATTQAWQPNQTFVARPAMQEISLQVILQAVFGLTEGARYEELKRRLKVMLEFTSSRFTFATNFFPILQRDLGEWSPGGRFIRLIQSIDELLYAEIADRRQQFDPNRSDILTLLLSARDEAGEPMSDLELRDELMTLLVAGHETTATALSWALYWIHSLPDVKAKLVEELDSLGAEPDLNAIAKLPYLNAVCCETLRIYPVGFIAQIRIAQTPCEVGGYPFKRDSLLIPAIYLTHHRPDLYPEPNQFRPERFLERQYTPYEFLPFGGSNRRCIGAAFALFEMKLVLATVLRRCDLALAESCPVAPVRRGVTIAPNSGIRLKLISKRSEVAPSLETATA